MEQNNNSPRNVLLTCLSTLGDVAMIIPVIYPLCVANPKVTFVLVINKQYESLIVNKPSNLTVLGIEKKKYRTFVGALKLAKNLYHRYDFNAAADLQNSTYTWFIDKYLKHKGVTVSKIDKCRTEKRQLTSGKLRNAITTVHKRLSDAVMGLNLSFTDNFKSILSYGPPILSNIVPEKGAQERWIAIAPFSPHKGKAYPIEQMQMIIAEFARWDNTHIFLFGGGKKEHDILDPIMRRHKNVTSVVHIDHNFADEFALMHHCDVMLTMASANMHLAALVGMPVVSVWGATHPWCGEMGRHQALRDTVQIDLDCRPCTMTGNKRCRYGDYHCLHDINPEMIIKKVLTVLER